MNLDDIRRAYLHGVNRWTGCDWTTQFGGRNLNLDGLRSKQAAMVAECPHGEEAGEWRRATRWLSRVETDALLAEREAAIAVFLAIFEHGPEALLHAERACALEGRYHQQLVWEPLRQAIAAYAGEPVDHEATTLEMTLAGK